MEKEQKETRVKNSLNVIPLNNHPVNKFSIQRWIDGFFFLSENC